MSYTTSQAEALRSGVIRADGRIRTAQRVLQSIIGQKNLELAELSDVRKTLESAIAEGYDAISLIEALKEKYT